MRLSAKGRYALAAMVSMAQQHNTGEYITVISIAGKLGISKIYLEQVFSLLKRSGIVTSVKGAQGGYQLARPPEKITALDVFSAAEFSLLERAEDTVADKAPDIDGAMRVLAFDALDEAVKAAMSKVSLADLAAEADRRKAEQAPMFYI